jgi:hypothetical protein
MISLKNGWVSAGDGRAVLLLLMGCRMAMESPALPAWNEQPEPMYSMAFS